MGWGMENFGHKCLKQPDVAARPPKKYKFLEGLQVLGCFFTLSLEGLRDISDPCDPNDLYPYPTLFHHRKPHHQQ